MEDLKPTERPIHCSDKKRLQFYVKDDDIWKKDEDHEKLTKSIKAVSNIWEVLKYCLVENDIQFNNYSI